MTRERERERDRGSERERERERDRERQRQREREPASEGAVHMQLPHLHASHTLHLVAPPLSPLEVFSCSPTEATIEAGQEQKVVVTFAPDHARPDRFVGVFAVKVPMQESEQTVTVRGRCWDRQVQ